MFIKFVMFTNESFKLSFSMIPNHGNIICVPPPQPMFFRERERQREREWGIQNLTIAKNGVLTATALFL